MCCYIKNMSIDLKMRMQNSSLEVFNIEAGSAAEIRESTRGVTVLYESEEPRSISESRGTAPRGIVDGLVVGDRDLWLVVARSDESIEEWLHGGEGDEIAPLMICRGLTKDRLLLDASDPDCDRLLSELEDEF
jgi:hypothetical protein